MVTRGSNSTTQMIQTLSILTIAVCNKIFLGNGPACEVEVESVEQRVGGCSVDNASSAMNTAVVVTCTASVMHGRVGIREHGSQ